MPKLCLTGTILSLAKDTQQRSTSSFPASAYSIAFRASDSVPATVQLRGTVDHATAADSALTDGTEDVNSDRPTVQRRLGTPWYLVLISCSERLGTSRLGTQMTADA